LYPHVRDSGYETTSSNIDQQRLRSSINPLTVNLSPNRQLRTVNYYSTPISNHRDSSISRTLTTFSYIPITNSSGNELSTMTTARLAEQEVIEV